MAVDESSAYNGENHYSIVEKKSECKHTHTHIHARGGNVKTTTKPTKKALIL